MMSAKCQLQTLVPIIEPRGVKRHVGSYSEAREAAEDLLIDVVGLLSAKPRILSFELSNTLGKYGRVLDEQHTGNVLRTIHVPGLDGENDRRD